MNETIKQLISLDSRKVLRISGVEKIDSLNPLEFQIKTNMGNLKITGENMEMKSFDVDKGDMLINGTINSLSFYVPHVKKPNKSFIQKLFK